MNEAAPTAPPPIAPLGLSVRQASEATGFSTREIIEAMQVGALGHVRRGRAPKDWIVTVHCLQDWLERNTVRPWSRTQNESHRELPSL